MARRGIVVVGSGPIGAVAARRFCEAGEQVTLLEAGEPISSPPGSHVRNQARFQQDPDSYFAGIEGYFRYFDETAPPAGLPGASTTTAVGGQGVLWTNNCPRPAAFELWPVMPDVEWDRYLEDAERYFDVRDDTFDASVRQRCITERLRAPLAEDGREIVGQPMAGRLVDTATIHYVASEDILAGADVGVRHGEVRRVDTDGERVVGVELTDGERIDAEVVVVAAGAFDTPLLLHRSGLGSAALGKYVTYHPVLFSQLVLDESLCRGDGYDIAPRLQIPPTVAAPWNTMILRDTCPAPAARPDIEVAANRLVEIQSFCPVDNHSENAMVIDDSGVWFDVPLREADRARMDAVLADQHRLAAALGRFRAGVEPQWMDLGFAHVMGTCRMGAVDDGTSVTDGFGEVWGTRGLYLATVGVIPTALAVNPTLTAAALALRSVDHALRQ
ncbi:FAD-dependent oxidoreductase [Mycobacterium sp. NPDC051804]|uniref:FAD-dependent oxidoreductase n=1 Tax=Mycobacterium sp. NPDC051804 TaxID=3364295 RepID=UPI00379DBF91